MNTSNKQAEQANTPPEIKDEYIVENSTRWTDEFMSIQHMKESESDGVIGTRQGILQRREQKRRWTADDNKRIKEYLRSLIRGSKTDPFLLVPVDRVIFSLKDKLDNEPNEIVKSQIQRTLDLVTKDKEDGVDFYIIDGQNRLRLAIVPFLKGEIRLGEQSLPIRKVVIDGPDVMYSLAGKTFDEIPTGIQEMIKKMSNDVGNPFFRVLQILEHLR